jgi:protoporphyrinogen oxidase
MRKVVIIGAGPAGLAAGDALCSQGVEPIILEKEGCVGGLSRTMEYKGYRLDIGSHRFFTKSESVFSWWKGLLGSDFGLTPRQSRIYYNGVFFNYPLSIRNVLSNVGLASSLPILLSYLKSRIFPHAQEYNFERWVTNRFGRKLYRIFFKEYTEKVWGMSCDRISSDWASQRIKGLSLSSAVRNAILPRAANGAKTLIKEFYYPRLGSGMMYEKAALRMAGKGARFVFNAPVARIYHDGKSILAVSYEDKVCGKIERIEGTHFCSSMPITDLILRMDPIPPQKVLQAARTLHYRSLVMVYLIVDRPDLFSDNWIYVNSNDVAIGRISNYRNWSKDMVPDRHATSLGLEYFCAEGDTVWNKADSELIATAENELRKLKFAKNFAVIDGCVLRLPNAYPVYENGYARALEVIKGYVCSFLNLSCMGRYGMFRYNNMDHSVLTGLLSARNILGAREDIWNVNMDKAYHEELEEN